MSKIMKNMTQKYDNKSNKTLGCKVPTQFYNHFLAKANQLDMTPSMLMRNLLMKGIEKKIAEMPKKGATPKPKRKRRSFPMIVNDSILEQTSSRIFELPDLSLITKPSPPDCNPINYATPDEKIGALVRRMQCLSLRTMMVQNSGRPKN
jgi:hypothetical protein